ncbi:hypothetical protein SAMN04515647_4438 [Cohaesibacter sp. ES.047]|nr:hypothetical protein [Cohaesibacter sp. ES.047]SNY94115.1 hypothetical protein SAMN04515647_4438 [Cohaesibacter sp. ES.047]
MAALILFFPDFYLHKNYALFFGVDKIGRETGGLGVTGPDQGMITHALS